MTITILPPIYTHSTPLTTLAPYLVPHLPQSLPLLRRLQFHAASPSARILASFPPSTSRPPPSFAATWTDRTRAPETECWLFSTYETLPAPPPAQRHEARAQCLALLAHIARLPPPTPSLLVIGSLNERLLHLLVFVGGDAVLDRLVPQGVVSRARARDDPDTGGGLIGSISLPYRKFLIPPPHPERPSVRLPRGYAYAPVRGADLALVVARTAIPKTEATLAALGSVGVRCCNVDNNDDNDNGDDNGDNEGEESGSSAEAAHGALVAWAFLGVDGSLSTLHVEAAHRRRGIATAVAGRLCRRLVGGAAAGVGFRDLEGDGGDGAGWAHSDVAVDNVESAGVARGLGGTEGWRVRWVGVDLAAVGRVVGE